MLVKLEQAVTNVTLKAYDDHFFVMRRVAGGELL
jgi:hypothetical protein